MNESGFEYGVVRKRPDGGTQIWLSRMTRQEAESWVAEHARAEFSVYRRQVGSWIAVTDEIGHE